MKLHAASQLLFLLMRTQHEERSKNKSLVKNYQCQLAGLAFRKRDFQRERYSWCGAARKYWLSISESTHTLLMRHTAMYRQTWGILRTQYICAYFLCSSSTKKTSAIARWRGNLLRFQTGNVPATTFGFISKRAANNKPGGAAPGCILYSTGQSLSGWCSHANTRRIIIFTSRDYARRRFARAQVQGIPDTFAHGQTFWFILF